MLCTDELIYLLQIQLAERSQPTPPQPDGDWQPGMGTSQKSPTHPPRFRQAVNYIYGGGNQSPPW